MKTLLDDAAFLFESHRELLELRREIELDGLPADPEDIRRKFCDMVDNAEGLRILFGGHPDRKAVEEAHELIAIIRAASAKEAGVTHHVPRTRH